MALKQRDTKYSQATAEMQKMGLTKSQSQTVISLVEEMRKNPQTAEAVLARATELGIEDAVRAINTMWDEVAPKKKSIAEISSNEAGKIFKAEHLKHKSVTGLSDREFLALVSHIRSAYYRGEIGTSSTKGPPEVDRKSVELPLYERIGKMCSEYEQIDRNDAAAVRGLRRRHEVSLRRFLDDYYQENKAEINRQAKLSSVPSRI